MKNILICILLLLQKLSFAQSADSALYLQFPAVPPFSIMKVPDSTTFTKADLKNRKATLIIMFSPDCDHCKHETKELLDNIELFKKVQIVMVAHLDFILIKEFYETFNIGYYPNITIGRDGAYFLGTFYKIHNYPTMFLYNKKGEFIKMFEGSIPVQKIAESL